MSIRNEYDVIVLGSGPSGRTVSLRTVKNGLSVALVEDELVGGDCHYWACVPSKAMLRPPEALTEAREIEGAKQALTGQLGVEAVINRRDGFVDHWNDVKVQGKLEKSGVKVVHGHGRLDGQKRVIVTSPHDPDLVLTARHAIVVSTGSRALIPEIPGLTESRPWTNRNATSSKKPPATLAIMGGGPVGCEMATAYSALGSKVTILERKERLLSRYEPFAGEQLSEAFARRGISVLTGVSVVRVNRREGAGKIEITLDDGSAVSAHELLVAVGRQPNTDRIGLETVGLKPGEWLNVDDTCTVRETGGNWLYAVGDVNHRALLTHVGKYQARACAATIAARVHGNTMGNPTVRWSKLRASSDNMAVPQVIFSDPQVATVGLTESAARAMRMNVKGVDCDVGAVDGAKLHTDGYVGHAKIIIDESRHVLVGATFIGPQVGDLLQAAIAIVGEVPLDRLWHAIPSFPTVSEVWLSLLENYGY